jgi:hypothetical protein
MREYVASIVNMRGAPADDGITFEVKCPASRKREAERIIKRNFPELTMVGLKCVGHYDVRRIGPDEFWKRSAKS